MTKDRVSIFMKGGDRKRARLFTKTVSSWFFTFFINKPFAERGMMTAASAQKLFPVADPAKTIFSFMLTPTDIHYLVSILMSVSQNEEVEIELGSLLYDEKAEIKRDIDITIKYSDPAGGVKVFAGVEVKAKGRPLSVEVVEQLIFKAMKIPSINEINIVSASGFAKSAQTLADRCSADLYGRKLHVNFF